MDKQVVGLPRGAGLFASLHLISQLRKVGAIGAIALRTNLAYVKDLFARSVFILVILFVFTQLWGTTYSVTHSNQIAGYKLSDMIWYLTLTESVFTALPRLSAKIDSEIREGTVAYRLLRPVSYLLFHYAEYMAEVCVRIGINLVLGGALTLALYRETPFTTLGVIAFIVLTFGAATLNFVLGMIIAICAFWMEDTRGLELIYTRLVMTMGGMMLPLSIFPNWLQTVSRFLPFQSISYAPARVAVHFDSSDFAGATLIQWGWTAVGVIGLSLLYRLAIRKVQVNGG